MRRACGEGEGMVQSKRENREFWSDDYANDSSWLNNGVMII